LHRQRRRIRLPASSSQLLADLHKRFHALALPFHFLSCRGKKTGGPKKNPDPSESVGFFEKPVKINQKPVKMVKTAGFYKIGTGWFSWFSPKNRRNF
jgi:hypothetical protein